MKTLTLEKDYSIKLSSKVVDYIYPDYVFIPMHDWKLRVKNNEEVKKEQELLISSDNQISYSPISGKVVGAKECIDAFGNSTKCLVIENDFKEKMFARNSMRKNLKQLSYNDFITILSEKRLTKLLNIFAGKKTIDNIILTGIEDEPYIATKIFLLNNFSDAILETLSFLARIFNVKNNIIVLKENDRENLDKYSNILGTYPEISLQVVPDLYPINNNDSLKSILGIIQNNTVTLTPDEVLEVFNAVKKNKLITEKYITITGNAIENPIVVNAKLGSSVKKIIDEAINFLNNDEVDYVVNGLMTGDVLEINDLIVTNDLEGIIINYKKDYQERACINCGKCNIVCPVSIDPNLIFNKKKRTELKDKCINCGLCTYICPSYINFKEKIKEMKHEK